KIDTKQPSSSDNNDHAWHNAAYTVHLAATDAPSLNAFSADSSGVATVNYNRDGASTHTSHSDNTYVTHTALTDHSTGGLLSIKYTATPDASTLSLHDALPIFKIDTKQPSSSDNNDHAWHNAAYTVHLAATDAPALNAFSADSSGVATVN